MSEPLSDVMKRLTYVEGEMFTAAEPHKTIRACWLADETGDAVCVVTEGADFERCGTLLKQAAAATQLLPELVAACEAAHARLEPFTLMRSPDMVEEYRMLSVALAHARELEVMK